MLTTKERDAGRPHAAPGTQIAELLMETKGPRSWFSAVPTLIVGVASRPLNFCLILKSLQSKSDYLNMNYSTPLLLVDFTGN